MRLIFQDWKHERLNNCCNYSHGTSFGGCSQRSLNEFLFLGFNVRLQSWKCFYQLHSKLPCSRVYLVRSIFCRVLQANAHSNAHTLKQKWKEQNEIWNTCCAVKCSLPTHSFILQPSVTFKFRLNCFQRPGSNKNWNNLFTIGNKFPLFDSRINNWALDSLKICSLMFK